MKIKLKKFLLCLICTLLVAMPLAELCPAQTAEAATAKAATKKAAGKKSTTKKKKKILLAYYSQSGTTEKVAKRIEKMTGATLFRIQTRKKYPSNYDKLVEVGEEEQERQARPALKKKVKSMKSYDTVILGFPIWWDDAPMAVYTFLESYNLSGKTILPFCTSGGSDISESVRHLRRVCKKSTVKRGLTANDVSDKRISNWLVKNGVSVKEEISVQLQIGKTKVTKKTYSMETGTTKTVKATSSKKISSVKYTSSNTKVASVSRKGVIRAKKAGTAKITAAVRTKQGNKSVWMKVKVNAVQPAPGSNPAPNPDPTPTPDPDPTPSPDPTPTPDPDPTPSPDPTPAEGKVLIAYFTRSGNTERIADIISEKIGGEEVRLETVKAYPEDYNSILNEAMEEKNSNARPELKTKIAHMEDYDTVFVGYPIWHGDTPMAIRTFLEEYDFTGKKVIPFCSSGSSSPDTSFAHVKDSAQGAEVLDGFWTASSGLANLETTVPSWLDGLGMTWKGNQEGTEGNSMKITAGNTTFTATLADNSSVTALKELLKEGPLTIDMSDYGNMEKVGSIGTSLPRNDEQITTGAGDIILYQGSSLVIYYDTNSWNFTRIGKIEGVTKEELLGAFGAGNVTVTFSLE